MNRLVVLALLWTSVCLVSSSKPGFTTNATLAELGPFYGPVGWLAAPQSTSPQFGETLCASDDGWLFLAGADNVGFAYSVSDDGSIVFRDTISPPNYQGTGIPNFFRSCAAANGTLVVGSGVNEPVVIFELKKPELVWSIKVLLGALDNTQAMISGGDPRQSVAISGDGMIVALADGPRVYELSSGGTAWLPHYVSPPQIVSGVMWPNDRRGTVALSADGSSLLACLPYSNGGTSIIFYWRRSAADPTEWCLSIGSQFGSIDAQLGWSTSLTRDGSLGLLGAPGTAGSMGAAYLLEFPVDKQWPLGFATIMGSPKSQYSPADGVGNIVRRFGEQVWIAPDGELAMASAPEMPNGTATVGAIYVYFRSGSWDDNNFPDSAAYRDWQLISPPAKLGSTIPSHWGRSMAVSLAPGSSSAAPAFRIHSALSPFEFAAPVLGQPSTALFRGSAPPFSGTPPGDSRPFAKPPLAGCRPLSPPPPPTLSPTSHDVDAPIGSFPPSQTESVDVTAVSTPDRTTTIGAVPVTGADSDRTLSTVLIVLGVLFLLGMVAVIVIAVAVRNRRTSDRAQQQLRAPQRAGRSRRDTSGRSGRSRRGTHSVARRLTGAAAIHHAPAEPQREPAVNSPPQDYNLVPFGSNPGGGRDAALRDSNESYTRPVTESNLSFSTIPSGGGGGGGGGDHVSASGTLVSNAQGSIYMCPPALTSENTEEAYSRAPPPADKAEVGMTGPSSLMASDSTYGELAMKWACKMCQNVNLADSVYCANCDEPKL